MPKWRELDDLEIKRLLKKKPRHVWDPVTYVGLPQAREIPGQTVKIRRIQERIVKESDVSTFLRNGWVIVDE